MRYLTLKIQFWLILLLSTSNSETTFLSLAHHPSPPITTTTTTTTTWTHRQRFSCAFAGGFGGNTSSKKKTTSKIKKKKSSLQELQVPSEKMNTADSSKVELDKWGLPPPTLEDIFPALPPETELIPATAQHKQQQSSLLSTITLAMKQHIPLTLQHRFDENGVERHPPCDGRAPMRLRLLHMSPPVLAIDNFMTTEECLQMEQVVVAEESYHNNHTHTAPVQVHSQTFARAHSTRTSTSWFCPYHTLPVLLSKARDVLGFPLEHMEEPQIVRYQTGQEFSWHYDEVPPPQLVNGGQRLATLLVYLNTVSAGGATIFRDLTCKEQQQLCVQPQQGTALLFFPAFGDGTPDDRTLHKGEPPAAEEEKRIVQMWIHERSYQAAVPPGNSQAVAVPKVDAVSRSLGYLS